MYGSERRRTVTDVEAIEGDSAHSNSAIRQRRLTPLRILLLCAALGTAIALTARLWPKRPSILVGATRLMGIPPKPGYSQLARPVFVGPNQILGYRVDLNTGRFAYFAIVDPRTGAEVIQQAFSRRIGNAQGRGIDLSPDGRWALWFRSPYWYATSSDGKITRRWPGTGYPTRSVRHLWNADSQSWLRIWNEAPSFTGNVPVSGNYHVKVRIHSLNTRVKDRDVDLGPASVNKMIVPLVGDRLLVLRSDQSSDRFAGSIYSTIGAFPPRPTILRAPNLEGPIHLLFAHHSRDGRFAITAWYKQIPESALVSWVKGLFQQPTLTPGPTYVTLASNLECTELTTIDVPPELRKIFAFAGWTHDGSRMVFHFNRELWMAAPE